MGDLSYIEVFGGASQGGEVGRLHIEGVEHAHGLELRGEFGSVFKRELGQAGVCKREILGRHEVCQRCAVQRVERLVQGEPLFWKQAHKAKVVVAIRFDEAGEGVVLQVAILARAHHAAICLGAVLRGEGPVQYVLVLIGIVPSTLEGQRADEEQAGIGRDVVDDLGNHAVGVLVHPCVDILQGGVVERRLERLRIQGVGAGFQVVLLHGEGIVFQPDGIGETQLQGIQLDAAAIGIRAGKAPGVGLEIRVEGVGVKAARLLYLGKRLSCCAVLQHGQHVEHGERRDQYVVLCAIARGSKALLEQGGCESVGGCEFLIAGEVVDDVFFGRGVQFAANLLGEVGCGQGRSLLCGVVASGERGRAGAGKRGGKEAAAAEGVRNGTVAGRACGHGVLLGLPGQLAVWDAVGMRATNGYVHDDDTHTYQGER